MTYHTNWSLIVVRELTLLKGKADEELEAGLLNRIFRSQYLADLLKEYVARIDQCLLELQVCPPMISCVAKISHHTPVCHPAQHSTVIGEWLLVLR